MALPSLEARCTTRTAAQRAAPLLARLAAAVSDLDDTRLFAQDRTQQIACSVVALALLLSGHTLAIANDSNTEPDCLAGAHRDIVQWQRVTDGDTLVLDDKRRVRIIGINTPELNTQRGRAQPMAEAAHDAVLSLLQGNVNIELIAGEEALDRHGRTLAHVRLLDGRDVASTLLSRGLAARIAIEPNTRCIDAFMALERTARDAELGVWHSRQDERHEWLLTDEPLRPTLTGFRIVQSRVSTLEPAGERMVMTLTNGLAVWMDKRLGQPLLDEARWHNRAVEVRGWISRRKQSYRLRLHNLTNLNWLE